MRLFFVLLFFSISVVAQKPDEVLATATGITIRVSDLSPQIQEDLAKLPERILQARISLLEQMVSRRVFDAEAKSRGITMGKLLADEKAKLKDPSETEIANVIEANRDRLAGLSPDQARKTVVAYLRNEAEQKALATLFDQLKVKFKVTPGKPVNSGKLLPTDVVATVNGQPITGKAFDDFVKVPRYEAQAEIADHILADIDEQIYTKVVNAEAAAQGIDSSTLIAREVTNKLKDFSDVERFMVEEAFRTKLYTKYQVKVLYTEPPAPRQVISADDDPATGPPLAPVKIIMFSDFQCSACAATHPVLKQVMAAYPGKVRFVVRDFPLESIHADAFAAARAANAAHAQGKFFEYIELLYKNQAAQDPASLRKYAAQIGLNASRFEIDFNSPAVAAEIRKDVDDGESYAVNGTPTIFVNGVRLRTLSAVGLKAAIDKALRR